MYKRLFSNYVIGVKNCFYVSQNPLMHNANANASLMHFRYDVAMR